MSFKGFTMPDLLFRKYNKIDKPLAVLSKKKNKRKCANNQYYQWKLTIIPTCNKD